MMMAEIAMWRIAIFLAAIVVSIGGCSSHAAATSCSWPIFREQPNEQKRMAFVECTPEQRLDLYLKHAANTIPPNFDFLDEVASSGSALLPPLMSSLESADPVREVEKPEILIILRRMQELGHYEVREDKELLSRIDDAVARISVPELKAWALDIAASLRKPKS